MLYMLAGLGAEGGYATQGTAIDPSLPWSNTFERFGSGGANRTTSDPPAVGVTTGNYVAPSTTTSTLTKWAPLGVLGLIAVGVFLATRRK